MVEVVWVFAYGALLAGVMAVHRKVLYLGIALVVLYIGVLALLSLPKPSYMEWRPLEGTLLAYQLVENEAIYIWLQRPGVPYPQAYTLPWSVEEAQGIQQAMRAGKGRAMVATDENGGVWVGPPPVPETPEKTVQ